jgi:hypothetical protein
MGGSNSTPYWAPTKPDVDLASVIRKAIRDGGQSNSPKPGNTPPVNTARRDATLAQAVRWFVANHLEFVVKSLSEHLNKDPYDGSSISFNDDGDLQLQADQTFYAWTLGGLTAFRTKIDNLRRSLMEIAAEEGSEKVIDQALELMRARAVRELRNSPLVNRAASKKLSDKGWSEFFNSRENTIVKILVSRAYWRLLTDTAKGWNEHMLLLTGDLVAQQSRSPARIQAMIDLQRYAGGNKDITSLITEKYQAIFAQLS